MRILGFASVLFFVCGFAAAEPGTVELRLAALHGFYEVNAQRADTLRMECFPAEISSISLRAIGEADLGEGLCDSGETRPSALILSAVFWNLENGFYGPCEPMIVYESGNFNLTWQFVPYSYAAFLDDFLKWESPILALSVVDGSDDACLPYSPFSTVVLSDFIVTIEGDFPVGTDDSSWGDIKSLFRDHR